jgi:hypothetical protein
MILFFYFSNKHVGYLFCFVLIKFYSLLFININIQFVNNVFLFGQPNKILKITCQQMNKYSIHLFTGYEDNKLATYYFVRIASK